MLYIENVQGSKLASAPLIINVDTIYVHTNVRKVERTDEEGRAYDDLYEYTERQYTYPEYKEQHAQIQKYLEQDNIDQYTLALVESGVL